MGAEPQAHPPGSLTPAATAAVTATRAAREAMERLEAAHGPLALHQSGGCCDGSAPICVGADELPPGPNDIRLGEVGATPVYIDADLYDRWGRPELEIDVAPGAAEGFSLEGLLDVHFVTRTTFCPHDPRTGV